MRIAIRNLFKQKKNINLPRLLEEGL